MLFEKLPAAGLYLTLVLCMAGCDRHPHAAHSKSSAHGHDHDDEGPPPVVVTQFTETLELFMEYPHLVKGQSAAFLAHVTVLATGEPVRSGILEFRVTGPEGRVDVMTLRGPRREGLYVPERVFDAPGRYRLVLALSGPQVDAAIDVGEIVVHETGEEAAAAAEAAARPEPEGTVPFLKEQQWKIGLRVERAGRREMVERLRLAGVITVPNDAQGIVAAPEAGRLFAVDGAPFPRLGDRVDAGQVVAHIEPPMPLLSEVALRSVDLEMKGLEIERDIRQAAARLDYARAEFDRFAGLDRRQAASPQELEAVRRDLRVAQAEHDAAMAMKRRFDGIADDLAEIRAAVESQTRDSHDDPALHHMTIRAPVSGQIIEARRVPGEHVDAGETIFRIADLGTMWVRADLPESDLGRLPAAPGAVVVPHGWPGTVIDVVAAGGRLFHVGAEVHESTRTVPLLYAIPNDDGLLRSAMFADVLVETRRTINAVVIPATSVVRDQGRPVAFVLLNGETFQRRELELGIADGAFVEVLAGIAEGERVVSHCAYALKLAAASPASFGHGHAH